MAFNYGKQFEKKFYEDFKKSFPDGTIDRLRDNMSGYLNISNISDFIGYNYPNIFYLECKSCLGNTFPFSDLTQYDKLKYKVGIKGTRVGVVIWFREHDEVLYVPISTITKMMEDNKKSINILKSREEGYRIITIPSVKKRVFLDSNYSCLQELQEGE